MCKGSAPEVPALSLGMAPTLGPDELSVAAWGACDGAGVFAAEPERSPIDIWTLPPGWEALPPEPSLPASAPPSEARVSVPLPPDPAPARAR